MCPFPPKLLNRVISSRFHKNIQSKLIKNFKAYWTNQHSRTSKNTLRRYVNKEWHLENQAKVNSSVNFVWKLPKYCMWCSIISLRIIMSCNPKNKASFFIYLILFWCNGIEWLTNSKFTNKLLNNWSTTFPTHSQPCGDIFSLIVNMGGWTTVVSKTGW